MQPVNQVKGDPFDLQLGSSRAAFCRTNCHPFSDLKKVELWVVMIDQIYYHSRRGEVDTNVVGIFSSREAAVENAKVALSNMSLCEDVFDKDGNMNKNSELWDEMEDYSDSKSREHEDRDVLFRVSGVDSDSIQARMMKSFLDTNVERKIYGDDTGSEEESD